MIFRFALYSGEDKNADSRAYSPNIQLEPCTRYFWRVTVCDNLNNRAVSDTAWFETGKMNKPFMGKRITPDLPRMCAHIFEKPLYKGKVKSARAYFTGLGVYELYINGEKVGGRIPSTGL